MSRHTVIAAGAVAGILIAQVVLPIALDLFASAALVAIGATAGWKAAKTAS